jgi:site-specific recombinase XerD
MGRRRGGILMNLNPAFTHEPVGALADIIGDFITFKRSQGLKYIIEENVLYRFSVFSQNYRIENKLVPQKLISAWFERRPEEKPNTHSSRCSCINRLFRYAMNFGYHVEITEIPKHRNVTYMPYIFTESEITRFFNACDTVGRYPGSFRHMIIPVVFRLLYCCGLRVSEATGLKIKDVDLANCVLTIREPKNGRDRYVPMSMSLAGIMQKFSILTCRAFPTGEEFFFSGKYNNHLSRHQVYHWFRRCLEKAAIPHRGKGIGPREHDLRHSFCVHSLKLLCLQGLDVYCFLPWLSAYVGHKSIRATQYYLRLTADIFPELIEQITKNCMYVIPELTKEQAHETN